MKTKLTARKIRVARWNVRNATRLLIKFKEQPGRAAFHARILAESIALLEKAGESLPPIKSAGGVDKSRQAKSGPFKRFIRKLALTKN